MKCLELLFLYSNVIPDIGMLKTAVKHDNVKAMEFMILKGANLNGFVSEDSTLLDYADREGCSSEMFKLLVDNGAFSSRIL